jgi:hypothetical protein
MNRLVWTLLGICIGMFLSQLTQSQPSKSVARKSRTPEAMSPTYRNMATQDTDLVRAPDAVRHEARALVAELVQPDMTELEASQAREILTLQLFNIEMAIRDEASNRSAWQR